MELLQPCQVNIPLNQVFGDKMSEKLPWKNHILREDAGRRSATLFNIYFPEDFHTFC